MHRVRAAADPERPGRDHHVLRRATGVIAERVVQQDDRDGDDAPLEVPASGHQAGELAMAHLVAEHHETPGLPVLAAPRRAAGLEDLHQDVLGHRPLRVLADLALGDDREVRVHYTSPRRRRSSARISAVEEVPRREAPAPIIARASSSVRIPPAAFTPTRSPTTCRNRRTSSTVAPPGPNPVDVFTKSAPDAAAICAAIAFCASSR